MGNIFGKNGEYDLVIAFVHESSFLNEYCVCIYSQGFYNSQTENIFKILRNKYKKQKS